MWFFFVHPWSWYVAFKCANMWVLAFFYAYKQFDSCLPDVWECCYEIIPTQFPHINIFSYSNINSILHILLNYISEAFFVRPRRKIYSGCNYLLCLVFIATLFFFFSLDVYLPLVSRVDSSSDKWRWKCVPLGMRWKSILPCGLFHQFLSLRKFRLPLRWMAKS